MPSATQRLGHLAESAALEHLTQAGLRCFKRNFNTRFGEIDLVMIDGPVLVFVEVRLRTNRHYGSGAASVTRAKQQRLLKAAKIFLARFANAQLPTHCRFDVVSVSKPNYAWTFDWIRDAFSDNP